MTYRFNDPYLPVLAKGSPNPAHFGRRQGSGSEATHSLKQAAPAVYSLGVCNTTNLKELTQMSIPIHFHPLRDRDFLIASNLVPVQPGSSPSDLWHMAHLLTTSAASYCSEKRIHPAQVCAWFGAREPSECYNEAAMLASMALLETLKGRGDNSWN